jgi:hypothetical protein
VEILTNWHLNTKKEMLFISIPTPCHEKWNEMYPVEQGAFCNVCSKIVIDFTNLSDEEVQNYFLNNRGKKNCGRFRNDQLIDADDPLPYLLADSIPFWKKFLAIILIVFGNFLSGCQNNTIGKITNQEEEPEVKIHVTTGITLVDIIDEVEIGEPQIDAQCSTGVDTSMVIMGDIKIPPLQEACDFGIILERPRIDTPIKVILDENGCEKIVPITKSIQKAY